MGGIAIWAILYLLSVLREVQLSIGSVPPGERDAGLARLNRLVAENKELIDAVGKIIVPLTVALVAFFGVMLTVIARD